MNKYFMAQSATELWCSAASELFSTSVPWQEGRGGRTREILHAVLVLDNPRERWVVRGTRPLNVAFALAEVAWILAGRNDLAFLDYWNSKYKEFTGNTAILHGAYGHRLRKHFGMDQLEHAYLALRENPDSRQVVLQIWDPKSDLPGTTGVPRAGDIPCNIVSCLKVRDSRLEWLQVMRSNDLMLGLPYNIVQFTTLQEIMAGWLGMQCGAYTHISDSLHVYERDMSPTELAQKLPLDCNDDNLMLPWSESGQVVGELTERAEALTASSLSVSDLEDICKWPIVHVAYRNILLVLVAESARRRAYRELAVDVISRCSNQLLRAMWTKWRIFLEART